MIKDHHSNLATRCYSPYTTGRCLENIPDNKKSKKLSQWVSSNEIQLIVLYPALSELEPIPIAIRAKFTFTDN